MTHLISVLLWLSAVSCGVMAGVYFAFSTFIMQALGSIDRAAAVSTMNAINRVILRSAFMPLFFGSSLSSLSLTVIALISWGEPGAAAMLAGGIIYILGMLIVTMRFNVPLNNALEAAEPGDSAIWANYLDRWTRWNHVRTVASTAAMVPFIVAIAQR